MNTIELIFMFLGGIGLFFYGMQLLSDGLKKISGENLKKFIHSATKLPVAGVLVGALVTVLIQSSSATTVMVVGLVNAGLLQLTQAITVIMGANIGTTFTAWMVSFMAVFKITSYSMLAIVIGFIFIKSAKTRKTRFIGETILGFGLLFTGLSLMQQAFAPLQQSTQVIEIFKAFSRNPLLGVTVGMIFTILLQSSSATIAIVQVLALNGIIGLPAAISIVLGENIGTTATAQMAALNGNLSSRRAAMAHTMFNLIGVTYMLILIYLGLIPKFLNFIIPSDLTTGNIMFFIAVFHSTFNIFNTLLFLPFTGYLEKASIKLVPKRKGEMERGPQYLEEHLLDTPPLALEQIKNETCYMLKIATKSVQAAMKGLDGKGVKQEKKVSKLETEINTLQSEITQYIVELSSRELDDDQNAQIPVHIHNVNDIERIGDHAENIIDIAGRKNVSGVEFSSKAQKEIQSVWEKVQEMLSETELIFEEENTDRADKIMSLEEEVNRLQKNLKESHINRLNKKVCKIDAGVFFIDLVDNLEKIADHLVNVAEGLRWNMIWRQKIK